MANVSKEELLHIANLANLNIKDEEIESYLENLKDILNFAEIVNNANTEGLEETIGENDNKMLYLSILGSGAPFLIMAMVTAIVRPDE